MFGKKEFSRVFKVRDVVESAAGTQRKNAAHLRILAIDDNFIHYQSVRSKSKDRIRYSYLGIIVEAFPELNPLSIQKSVNAALKRAGFHRDYRTETYAYSLAKEYCKRAGSVAFLSPGESPYVQLEANTREFQEGHRLAILVERIERDPRARAKCIRHFGAVCYVCKLSFEQQYGEFGKGFIHVHHHRQQLAATKGKHMVDPIRDLIPLCPNCHAMVHRRNPMLAISELSVLLASNGSNRRGLAHRTPY